jgi:uncharacterized protein YegL
MPNQNLTEIVMIVDRSGSMVSIKDDAQGGFNAFIEEQKKLPDEARLTLVQFDSEYEMLHENRPLKDIPAYTLIPRGNTALLDAIGRTLAAVGERLAKTSEDQRPGKVLVVVITDGQENASTEYNREKVFEAITHQKDKYKWEFLFLAANQDAIKAGASIGIRNSMNFGANSKDVVASYNLVTERASQYRSTGHVSQMPVNVGDSSNKK